MDHPAGLVPQLCDTATRHQYVVFDIGGTWFRSALREPDGTLTGLTRQPAINYLNHPGLSQQQLRQGLVDYIIQQTQRLEARLPGFPLRVSISMGAAVNGHSGVILNAGPLWGHGCEPFDLKRALAQARNDVAWSVINDVTALVTHFARRPEYRRLRKISVLTVSTGIACRTIEVSNGRVPLHSRRGVQGEIGHVPIDFLGDGKTLQLRCDCGGNSHLNAYCSGRGIPQVMARLASMYGRPEWQNATSQDPSLWAALLRQGLDTQDSSATTLLNSVVRPLAGSIISLLSVDPEVAKIVVTGGVPHSLGEAYKAALLHNLTSLGLYMISDDDPDYFLHTIDFAESESYAGLHGAAIAADVVESATRSTSSEPTVLLSHQDRRMTEILKISYDVTLTDSGAGKSLVSNLTAMDAGVQPVLFVDAAVVETHGAALVSALQAYGFHPILKSVLAGEASKSWTALEKILRTFASVGVSRSRHPIVAVGGGAVLDVVGLAAGLYRRGVPYVRVPTSLVGLIDAAVGAKVAINLFGQKNRLGLFYPPKSVILDVAFLQTLPPRFVISGVAEAIKVAAVTEPALFDLLELHSDRLPDPAFYRTGPGLELVARAADAMMSSLAGNLWEGELERSVDFGHSLSQVLESAPHAATHGEAVAIDMALSLEIGRGRGVTSSRVADRIVQLIRKVGLPTYSKNVTVDQLFSALKETASHRGGRQRLPLVREVGCRPAFVSDIERSELAEAWSRLSYEGDRP